MTIKKNFQTDNVQTEEQIHRRMAAQLRRTKLQSLKDTDIHLEFAATFGVAAYAKKMCRSRRSH